jgi:hypothetical protein
MLMTSIAQVPPWRLGVLAVQFLLLLLLPDLAAAHERSISYSTWTITERSAHVVCRISALDVSRFPWAAEGADAVATRVGTYLSEQLRLLAGDAPCRVTDGPRRLASPPERLAFEWRVTCGAGPLRLTSSLLLDVASSHVHFARVREGANLGVERVLSKNDPTWPLPLGDAVEPQPESAGTSLAGYIELGLEHILTGYDHLAFLLALLLIETSLAEVARVVTGFTIAHSVTLALATLGYVRPEAAAIEALIGLSIALVAAENVWLHAGRGRWLPWVAITALGGLALAARLGHGSVPALTFAGLALFCLCYFDVLRRTARPTLARWAIAFLFGLVHGFGFAGVLAEAQLPPDRLAGALLGFNVGVELGQLGIVALVWPLFRWSAQPAHRRARALVIEVGSAAVCGLGLFWFATRAFE